jgi:hypothetical protein
LKGSTALITEEHAAHLLDRQLVGMRGFYLGMALAITQRAGIYVNHSASRG